MRIGLTLLTLFLVSCGGSSLEVSCEDTYAYVNTIRLSNKISPLISDPSLDALANTHASFLASSGKVEHSDALSRGLGENVAGGFYSAEEVMDGFLSSEGHRKNILLPEYKRFGSACVAGKEPYVGYWVQLFSY